MGVYFIFNREIGVELSYTTLLVKRYYEILASMFIVGLRKYSHKSMDNPVLSLKSNVAMVLSEIISGLISHISRYDRILFEQ